MNSERGQINLREIAIGKEKTRDLVLIMAWRNQEPIYDGFVEQQSLLKWKEHHNWWTSRKDRVDFFIIYSDETGEREVGIVNIDHLKNKLPEVGILVGELTLQRKGVATGALNEIFAWMEEKGYEGATARILKSNVASIGLFEKVGFEQTRESENTKKGKLNHYQLHFSNLAENVAE